MTVASARVDTVSRGFTLVEVAIVIFILTLLLGTFLVPLSAQVGQRAQTDAKKQMSDINDALLGFVAAYGYLPCPDSNNDGVENVTGAACTAAEGNLPWVTLGIGNEDPWGQRYRYQVSPAFAQRPSVITLASTGLLRVCQSSPTATPCNSTSSNKIVEGAAAIVASGGKNLGNCSTACPDDAENRDGDVNFVSRAVTDPGTTAGEFDDFVIWLSPVVIFNRLIAAEKLP